ELNNTDHQKATAIGTLLERLAKRNYDVKPLKFELGDPKVPDDATMVVLAGPRQTYAQPAIDALQKYMTEKKGRLVLLVDVPSGSQSKTMPDTGLEALLASFQVELAKERILTIAILSDRSIRDPEKTVGNFSDAALIAKNPVAIA